MCDSMVALPDVTKEGDLIFAKNSDRPAGEIQDAIFIPAQTHGAEASLECTYMTIPQVKHTLGVIISRPSLSTGLQTSIFLPDLLENTLVRIRCMGLAGI